MREPAGIKQMGERWEPHCSVRQYLNEDYNGWPATGKATSTMWLASCSEMTEATLAHAEMHERLIDHLSELGENSNIPVLPSFTLQITPTRF